MSEAADKLRAARELIARPGGWTQNAFARSINRRQVGPDSAMAVCWCALGAIRRATNDIGAYQVGLFLQEAVNAPSIEAWNDHKNQTREGVLLGFDRAIALAEADSAHG